MTSDFASFVEVTVDDLPPQGRAVQQIDGFVAGLDQWFLYADTRHVYRSSDFATWEHVGLTDLSMARGFQLEKGFLAVSADFFVHPYLYHSPDGLRWEIAEVVGPEDARDPVELYHDGEALIVRANQTVYRTRDGAAFALARQMDFVNTGSWAASKGDVVFGVGHQWIIARDARQAPTLLSDLPAPVIAKRAVAAGRSFEIALETDRESATFQAFPMPAGVSLDEDTGVISGTIETPGNYQWLVNAANGFGVGSPGLIQIVCYVDSPAEGPKLRSFTEVDGDFLQDPFLVAVGIGGADQPERFRIDTDTHAASLRIETENLPPGYAIDERKGIIIGSPTHDGEYQTRFTLISPGGRTEVEKTFIVYDSRNDTLRLDGHVQVVLLGDPSGWRLTGENVGAFAGYVAYGLPPGIVLDAMTGEITGTFSEFGVFDVVIVGRTHDGRYSSPARRPVNVQARPDGGIPDPWTEFTAWEGEAGISLRLMDGERLEILSVPPGMSFVPPASLVFEENLPLGIYSVGYRKINEIGMREGTFVPDRL